MMPPMADDELPPDLAFETLAVHAGAEPEHARAEPGGERKL
jgi:hypothetical protein